MVIPLGAGTIVGQIAQWDGTDWIAGGLTNGSTSAVGSNVIVATSGYADLPTDTISITLPVAGTYLIFYSINYEISLSTNGELLVEFYNVTDASDITSTQRGAYQNLNTLDMAGILSAISIVTVAASKNLRVYAYRAGTGGTITVLGAATLESSAGYVRLA